MTEAAQVRSYLTQRDLEKRWQLSGRTLERWRAEGYGPAWSVLGGSIRYEAGDVVAFENLHRHGVRGARKAHQSGGVGQ